MKKPELLAPAGNIEKLKVALAYGADAVYLGGKQFGLRAFADNFDNEEIREAVSYTHKLGKKIYVTMNIFAHNDDFDGMKEYISFLAEIGVDDVILSDPGVLTLVRETAPELEIHLSTQANNTNWRSAIFWHEQGVKRIILARELSLEEIRTIRENTPETLELECFVHGAMCISYSGRCMLSNYFTGRDANRGQCAHPCRWKYYLMEEKRPGQYFPVFEDERGTYILNSKDLSMLEHIPDLIDAGIDSFKIEGRMKSSHYVATIVKTYRQELDSFFKDPNNYSPNPEVVEETKKVSHRPFTTGFYYKKPTAGDHEYSTSKYVRNYDFIGMVLDYDSEKNMALIEQRNYFKVGDNIEIMRPDGDNLNYTIEKMYDEDGQPITVAPHPQQKVYIPVDEPLSRYSILRRLKE